MADNPFLAQRRFLDVYEQAIEAGLSDADYLALVSEADERIAEVDGTGFRTTPLVELERPDGGALVPGGPILAKVETANVGGSHKARHLFGLLLHLMIEGGATTGEAPASQPPLAIASCGNAALGAGVVAAAARRKLRVFVPTDADEAVLERLTILGAEIVICHRQPGEDGDPCIVGLHQAVDDGAEAFTVQGPVCPAVIDGGRTLGLELAEQLDERDADPSAIYIQIGGGALATAVMDGLTRRWPNRRLPRLYPVQAHNAHPYIAGWERLAPRLLEQLGLDDPSTASGRAAQLAASAEGLDLPALLQENGELMSPWPTTPHSVASGILDDLTYDWVTLMSHQIKTGGWPILVEEETFVRARSLVADLIDPPPDETGAAGLAGLLQHREAEKEAPDDDQCAVVLLTGVVRS